MIYLTYWLTKREFLLSYPTWAQFLLGLFASGLSLLVYAFTSKALEPAFASSPQTQNLFQGSFFSYIVLGELILCIPIHLLSTSADTVKQLIIDESFEHWLLAPGGLLRPLFSSAIGSAIKDWLVFFTTVYLACWVLDTGIGFREFSIIAFYQILFFPLFFFFGLVAVATVIAFGRGSGVIGQIGAGLTIFAGAFFPLKSLPTWLHELSLSLSPYTLFLESLRNTIADRDWILPTKTFLSLGAWTALTSIVGISLLRLALSYRRKKGDPIVLVPET